MTDWLATPAASSETSAAYSAWMNPNTGTRLGPLDRAEQEEAALQQQRRQFRRPAAADANVERPAPVAKSSPTIKRGPPAGAEPAGKGRPARAMEEMAQLPAASAEDSPSLKTFAGIVRPRPMKSQTAWDGAREVWESCDGTQIQYFHDKQKRIADGQPLTKFVLQRALYHARDCINESACEIYGATHVEDHSLEANRDAFVATAWDAVQKFLGI